MSTRSNALAWLATADRTAREPATGEPLAGLGYTRSIMLGTTQLDCLLTLLLLFEEWAEIDAVLEALVDGAMHVELARAALRSLRHVAPGRLANVARLERYAAAS